MGPLHSSARFQTSTRSAKARSMNSLKPYRKIRHVGSPGGRLPLLPSLSTDWKHSRTAQVLFTRQLHPAAHRRMSGKHVGKASNHLGLRCYVLDTKFGPKYDVTKPLVRTRIRQDVSTCTCVAGLISPPRQNASTPSQSDLRRCLGFFLGEN